MAIKRKTTPKRSPPKTPPDEVPDNVLVARHLRAGWWLLLVFVMLGIALESMHGFKVDWYLKVGNESRRLLWRLAHAHGTFLALVNIALAASISIWRTPSTGALKIASAALLGATLLVPAGFFLGGLVFHSGDPGAGIALLPIGAALLVLALGITAISAKG